MTTDRQWAKQMDALFLREIEAAKQQVMDLGQRRADMYATIRYYMQLTYVDLGELFGISANRARDIATAGTVLDEPADR